jgi:large subunit ribosomal protein L21e
MVKRHGSFRSRTRFKLQKHFKDKGKISLTNFFQTFEVGENVILKAEPAYQKGMYYPRFHGRVGVIDAIRGDCYIVNIEDGKSNKSLIVHPVHLKKN